MMSGKTDPQILREIFQAAASPTTTSTRLLPDAMVAAERALADAEQELRQTGFVLPGVVALLERLRDTDGVRQTLLTGNLTANAAVKVAAFGLTDFFDAPVGAYGTDHADRLELVPIALERVARFRDEVYGPDEVWVIGDTANDLACARAGGVRCLLVGDAKGEDAVLQGADAAVADFTDLEAVFGILMS